EVQMSWGEVSGAVDAVARGLLKLGIEPGDRVALVLPNCPQFVIAYLACVRAGAMAVPLNPVLAPEEAAHIVADAGARAVVAVGQTAPLAQAAAAGAGCVEQLIVSGDDIPEGALDFRALLAGGPAELPEPRGGDEVAALMYTSGTTGRPKGAELTHRNLLFDARASVEAVRMSEDDVFLSVLPLFHSFGATVCMIIPMLMGATSVLVPRFEALPVLEAVERSRATIFPGVPSMFAVLTGLRTGREFDVRSLRLCISGGAALPRELTPAFEQRYGSTLLEGYGPTDASPVVSVNRSERTRKVGTVGPPLPGVEVEVRDEDETLPVGEIGEICVRGENVMTGYWRDLGKTARAIREGWLYTGDLGTLDDDGYITIVDRKTDMIIVSGLNVYPREVEDVIRRLPQVRDCAVVGRRSELRGEIVTAWMELHDGQAVATGDVIEHCSEHLARYKVPRQVHLADELPRSATGKVLKRGLREHAVTES
ncbi:MAG: long-chain fatty acid--CoA ligase, partial [Armatimonadota bacterium]|nr:long-chain fatty acid--CoA ligase [Armatimonadota bacterium]